MSCNSNIEDIKSACKSIGGISRIEISTLDNYKIEFSPYPNSTPTGWIDPAKVVDFNFRPLQCRLSDDKNDSDHGSSVLRNLEFSLLKARESTEHFKSYFAGKRVHVKLFLKNGWEIWSLSGKVRIRYSSGQSQNDPEEYIVTIASEFPANQGNLKEIA